MEDRHNANKSKWSEKFKNYLNNAALLVIGITLFLLAALIFEFLGFIEGDSDPVDIIWQMFWAVVWIIGIFCIFAVIYEVWKNRKK
jgi:hypothetical protein